MPENIDTRQAATREVREDLNCTARSLRRRATPSERSLWDALRNRQLDGLKFRRQSRIGQYIVDFYCAEVHLVIEVDGGVHALRRDEDVSRQQVIEDMGLTVLRISADHVETDLPAVLDRIRRVVSQVHL